MSLIGNVIWFICGGLLVALEYLVGGILMCLTIIGIPFGIQLFKIGLFAMLPFGQRTVTNNNRNGCLFIIMNVLWIIFGGIPIALTHLAWGVILCITVIGIPFGMQHFKLMTIAIAPFGRSVIDN